MNYSHFPPGFSDNNNDIINKFNKLASSRRKIITSYGIILFTVQKDIRFLCVQRRDSIAYTEFLKDNIDEKNMKKLVCLMTFEEKKRCLNMYEEKNPYELWDDLWVNKRNKIYHQDRERCCQAFLINMKKHISLFQDEKMGMMENRWGFPKGRKHISESDLMCALREFEEETTIDRECVQILSSKPFEEIYVGSDDKKYRNVFYLAFISKIPKFSFQSSSPSSKIQRRFVTEETSQIEWLTFHEALNKFENNKKQLFNRVNEYLHFTRAETHPIPITNSKKIQMPKKIRSQSRSM